jgi:hypothetical protein
MNLGSLTLPVPEAGDFVELLLLYTRAIYKKDAFCRYILAGTCRQVE